MLDNSFDLTLVVSTFVSNTRARMPDRGMLRTDIRSDVFRYMLSSLSVIPFSKVYIFFELDFDLISHQSIILEETSRLFPRANIAPRRLLTIGEWKSFLIEERLCDAPTPILYCGNDDHIFIDFDLKCLQACLQAYHKLSALNPLRSIIYSHYIEANATWSNQIYDDPFCSAIVHGEGHDSIQIVSPNLLRRWFFDETAELPNDTIIRRAEDIPHKLPATSILLIRPKRELFRHLDGYSHVGLNTVLPPIDIPSGFFNGTFQIFVDHFDLTLETDHNHVSRLKSEGWTILDPDPLINGNESLSGADLDRGASTIPLFWTNAVKTISANIPNEVDRELAARRRKRILLQATRLSNSAVESLFPDIVYSIKKGIDVCPKYLRTTRLKVWNHKVGDQERRDIFVIFYHRGKHKEVLTLPLTQLQQFKVLNPGVRIGVTSLVQNYHTDHVGYYPTHGTGGDQSFWPLPGLIDKIYSFVEDPQIVESSTPVLLEILNHTNANLILLIEQTFVTKNWDISYLLNNLRDCFNELSSTVDFVFFKSTLQLGLNSISGSFSSVFTSKSSITASLSGAYSDTVDNFAGTSNVQLLKSFIDRTDSYRSVNREHPIGQLYYLPLLSTHGFSTLSALDLQLVAPEKSPSQ